MQNFPINHVSQACAPLTGGLSRGQAFATGKQKVKQKSVHPTRGFVAKSNTTRGVNLKCRLANFEHLSPRNVNSHHMVQADVL